MLVGRIGGAYGIKGWLRINSFTEPAENIFSYVPWSLHAALDGKLQRTVQLVQGKPHGKGLVAQLEDVTDRDEAESLRGLEIHVSREFIPEPGAGQYYWADLEGLRVEDKAGNELGQLDQLLDTGSADVMVICGAKRHLIPFIIGETVIDVDLNAGCIRVDWDTEDD